MQMMQGGMGGGGGAAGGQGGESLVLDYAEQSRLQAVSSRKVSTLPLDPEPERTLPAVVLRQTSLAEPSREVAKTSHSEIACISYHIRRA